MLRIIFFAPIFFAALVLRSQDTIQYKKGSYLYYGQPNIEDNSMFIEEAFNQERAVIQHISNLVVADGDVSYFYTQEIPMPFEKFQFSFTVEHSSFKTRPNPEMPTKGGFGDLLLNFRPMLMDKTDWALVIPRFTIIAPTGNARYGLGSGAWGGQFNMAVTKRLNSRLTTHWNAGYTYLFKEDFYGLNDSFDFVRIKEKNHGSYNVGASGIFLVSDSFNLMCEYTSFFNYGFDGGGETVKTHELTLNPGFRVAFNVGKVQIVPGLGIPLYFEDGKHVNTGSFFYLSIEPNYLAK